MSSAVETKIFEHLLFTTPGFRPAFSCPLLDEALGPALRSGHVVEITGEAGSGKTQVALHLSAKAAIEEPILLDKPSSNKHVGKRVLYVCTEGPFPSSRLKDITNGLQDGQILMDRIYVESVQNIVSYIRNLLIYLKR